MAKTVLLIAPLFMNIYKEVKAKIESFGYLVDFIPEKGSAIDPNNQRGYYGIKKLIYSNPEKFKRENDARWESLLNQVEYSKAYDILFVIDGQSISPLLFETLKQRNKNCYAVNYLFDTISGVYRFDMNFKYFDKVFTFDRTESNKYKIGFLPIYWINTPNQSSAEYEIFALGRFSPIRYKLFTALKSISDDKKLKSYIKLATDREKHPTIVKIKWILRVLAGKTNGHIPPSFYQTEMNTYDSITPDEFRSLIVKSDTTVDTNALHQDGLTARFMWALGIGRKIITTNSSVVSYDFYDHNQIYIVDDVNNIDVEELIVFMQKKYTMSDKQRQLVEPYELTNWIKLLLNE